MRQSSLIFLLCLAATSVAVQAADTDASGIKPYPAEVALSKDKNGDYEYKSFPGQSVLYVYDGDVPATCEGCSLEWLPLLVPRASVAEELGDWAVVKLDDRQRQWTYKGRLVYTRHHNDPPGPNIEERGFHLLVP